MFQVTTINAFTDGQALHGNPAGVCLVDRFPGDADMQKIARQMGHSETAFLVPQGPNLFDLRWFTPQTEEALCGHATLAAAHYLRSQNKVDAAKYVCFNTKSGMLHATYQGDSIVLTLPRASIATLAPELLQSCIDQPIIAAVRSTRSYVIEVADLATLRRVSPNLKAIAALDSEDLIVTCKNGAAGYAYRCFCPQVGINEDPVTGSANCILAPYWAAKLNCNDFSVLQASAEGGALEVMLRDNHIEVAGKALTMNTLRIGTEEPVAMRGRA